MNCAIRLLYSLVVQESDWSASTFAVACLDTVPSSAVNSFAYADWFFALTYHFM